MHQRCPSLPLPITILLALALGCGGSDGTGPPDSNPPEPASVSISPGQITLDAPGATVQFSAVVRDALGRDMTGVSVTWGSSDPDVATISSGGLATAVANGSADIIAVATPSVSGLATLNVQIVEVLITGGTLEAGVVGEAYSQVLTVQGASDPVWSITAGALPDGLSLDPATGIISGIPTVKGVSHFTVTVTSGGRNASKAMSITVLSGNLGKGFGAEQFALIPAGSFQMGSEEGDSDEQPVHEVNLTGEFYMQKTEVTQGQWIEIMGTNPAAFSTCGETCPVERVSWEMVQQFLVALNNRFPGENFRLPTEAEWEYAARAGTTGAYGGTGVLDEMGWYQGNSQSKTQYVALKEANAWGLFDMHGNVEEWVQDLYSATYYGESPTDNPSGPASTESGYRVLRGGSIGRVATDARSAARSSGPPDNRGFTVYLGFRLAKDPS